MLFFFLRVGLVVHAARVVTPPSNLQTVMEPTVFIFQILGASDLLIPQSRKIRPARHDAVAPPTEH